MHLEGNTFLKIEDKARCLSKLFHIQIVTGTANGNLFVYDGCNSLHAKHLQQVAEAHDLAVLALRFAPVVEGEYAKTVDLSDGQKLKFFKLPP